MKNDSITKLQLGTLTFFLVSSFLMNTGYHIMMKISLNDSILDILFGGILVLLFGSMIFYIQRKNQENIITIINQKYPVVAKYILFLFIIGLLGSSLIYSLSILSSFIHYYVLKEVSIYIITFTLILSIVYITSKGIPTISKISEIFFYIYLFLCIISLIGVTKYLDFTNLKPLFTTSIHSHISSSIIYFSSSILPLFLLLVIPGKQIEDQGKHLPILLTIFSIILTMIQLIMIISILGISLSNLYHYPDMVVYKKISFLNILDRLETFLSFNNILNSMFFILMTLYFLKEVVNGLFQRKKEHITLLVIGFLLLITVNIIEISYSVYAIMNLVLLGFTLIIFLQSLTHRYNR